MFKKRKKTLVVLMVLLFAVSAWAGLRDRSSKIELYGEKATPGHYMTFPELSSAPSGVPPSGYGWVWIIGNDIFFRDDANATTSMIGAASGGVANLDEAYDGGGAGAGRIIYVDQSPVLFSGTNASNNVLDINASAAVTQHLINFTNSGSGRDIDGTSSTWYFTKAGVLGLANGLTIDNGTNNALEINENSEDLILTFASNLLDLSSTTGIVQVDLFDGAATLLTKAADGAADDLTISVTGAQNSSLHLASAGTAADAISIVTSAGGIDVTVAGGAAGEDIDITTDTSINLATTEDAASAITAITNGGTSETIVITNTQGTGDGAIDINGTAGGVDIDSGGPVGLTSAENTTDAVVIEATAGGLQILASGAAATEDILMTATGSSIKLNATEAAADAITITAATAAGGIDITSQADIDITTTGAAGEDITITNTGGSVNITATEGVETAIVIDASTAVGGIDITSNADLDITTAGAAGEDITVANTGGSVNITASEADAAAVVITASAGGIDISTAATFDIDLTATGGTIKGIASEAAADQFKIDAQGTVAGDAINFETTDGGVMINADGSANGDIELNSADDMTLTAAGLLTLSSGLVLPAEVVAATNVLTADECGLISFITAATEFDTQLPAISTAPAGCTFEFYVTAAADTGSYTVTTGNTQEAIINGIINDNNTLTACGSEDTITFVTGNTVGDHAKVVSDGTLWIITGEGLTGSKLTCTDET